MSTRHSMESDSTGSVSFEEGRYADMDATLPSEFFFPMHYEDLARKPTSDIGTTEVRAQLCSVSDAKGLLQSGNEYSWWDVGDSGFSMMYTLIKHYGVLEEEERRQFVDCLCSGTRTVLAMARGDIATKGASALRSSIRVVVFYTVHMIKTAEQVETARNRKPASRSSWTWTQEGREEMLAEVLSILECRKIPKAWGEKGIEDDFYSLLSSCALDLLESPPVYKDKGLRRLSLQVILRVIAHETLIAPVVARLMRLLVNQEHGSSVLASLLDALRESTSPDNFLGGLLESIMSVDGMDMGKDGIAGKNIGSVVSILGTKEPAFTRKNLSALMSLSSNESYFVRNGLVEAIANLIRFEKTNLTGDEAVLSAEERLQAIEERKERVSAMLTTIMVRAKDINAFARSKVMNILNGLVESECIPTEQYAEVGKLGLLHVHDKAAAVRKSSLTLLARMLEFNPFSPDFSHGAMRMMLTGGNHQVLDDFNICIQESCDASYMLLRSQSVSDVQGATNFLVTSAKFRVPGAEKCSRRLLPLLLSHDVSVRETTLRAFQEILEGKEDEQRLRALSTAHRLIGMAKGATYGELSCLSELFVHSKSVDSNVFQVLVDIAIMKVPNVPIDSQTAAAALVAIASGARSDVVRYRDMPVAEMLSSSKDPVLCRHLCTIASTAFAQDDEVAAAIEELLVRPDEDIVDLWLPVAEQALNALFTCSSRPEKAAEQVLRQLLSRAVETEKQDDLIRAVFAAGHIAVKQVIQVEISGQMIRKVRGKEQEAEEEEGNLADQLGEGSGALEAELERALEAGENEILQNNSVLRRLLDIIVRICGDVSDSTSSVLRAAAAISLCKLMSVCERTCKKHLRLVFSMLKSAREPEVRRNIVVAIGDLTFRFPNMLEPWTERIFMALQDPDVSVRKNATLTITHLILNDMLKVRGQIVGVLLLLHDEDTRISELARMFFTELSKKSGHVIYNIIPDVLSGLFQRTDLDIEVFRSCMRFLISFVKDRERQAEGTIEKLCHRFRSVQNAEEARHLAFCLSLLNYSDRSFRKLATMYKCYSSHLIDSEINSLFFVITGKAKKFSKQELRAEIDELERKIGSAAVAEGNGTNEPKYNNVSDISDSLSRVALQDVSNTANVQSPKAKRTRAKDSNAKRQATGLASAGRSRRRKVFIDEEADEESSHSDSGEDLEPVETASQTQEAAESEFVPAAVDDKSPAPDRIRSKRREVVLASAGRSRRRRVARTVAESSDEDDDSEADASYC